MSNEDKKDDLTLIIEAAVEAGVKKAIESELGDYKVDKEKHYKHHLTMDKVLNWADTISNAFWVNLVKNIVKGILVVLLIGLIVVFTIKGGGK